jgi:protein-tyrosine phosphatase
MVKDRIPALDGALNFRDLGGYVAQDGRTVRWNTLFRSGTTHAMTARDIAALEARHIRYAYDLRSNRERSSRPTRLTAVAQLEVRYLEHEHLPGDLQEAMKSPHAGPQQSRQLMISLYRELPNQFSAAYRTLFQHIADGDLPLVFNCTAGKDRTGVAAALLLTAIGISREQILEDYMLTERFFERSCEMILADARALFLKDVDRAVWEPLMRVHPDYLNAMFDELMATHGSVEHYMLERLGVDEAQRARMREHLLE